MANKKYDKASKESIARLSLEEGGVCQESCRIDFKNSCAITSFYIY